jgi:cytochrome c-type biogenesis protein CcmH
MSARSLALLVLLLASRAAPAPLEDRARDLERRLIAPCCWRQTVADHLSEESDRIKREIRFLLAEGRTEQEILDHYARQYGRAILAQPPYQGFHLLAYALPLLFLLALGVWLGRWLARARARPAGSAPVALPKGPYADQLARELRELDP